MTDYAGDITPTEAWDILSSRKEAVLVDVRTRPEWAFVGIPALDELGKKPSLISWQIFPDMHVNEQFAEEVEALDIAPETPVMFLCRSGARSRAAAQALTARGFTACYNVAGGFEGDPDEEHHRGRVNGWKAEKLPWIQQ